MPESTVKSEQYILDVYVWKINFHNASNYLNVTKDYFQQRIIRCFQMQEKQTNGALLRTPSLAHAQKR